MILTTTHIWTIRGYCLFNADLLGLGTKAKGGGQGDTFALDFVNFPGVLFMQNPYRE